VARPFNAADRVRNVTAYAFCAVSGGHDHVKTIVQRR